jgi:hypothetical protein
MPRLFAVTLSLALGASVFLAAPTAMAQGREQIIFSGGGEGSLGEAEFWIWCALDEAGNYDDCNGAIALDDFGLVRHVEGEVSEPDEGEYMMVVASTRDDSIACTLTNEPPVVHGPHNTVTVSCTTPSGSATAENAVVIATQ